jgi:hypothetical protein
VDTKDVLKEKSIWGCQSDFGNVINKLQIISNFQKILPPIELITPKSTLISLVQVLFDVP